jgi:ribosomal protein S18 acetylase RimI-like enzyme
MAKRNKEPVVVEITENDNLVYSAEQINHLFKDLSRSGRGKQIDAGELAAVLAHFNFHLYFVRIGNEIAGMGSLYFRQTLSRFTAYIEDVVVAERLQGQGLGGLLLDKLIYEARQNNVDVIELTSHPDRVAANAMYKKVGFIEPETNLYRMYL